MVMRYDEEAYAKSRYINAHNLFLGSSLCNADKKRNDIIFPVYLLSNAMTRGVEGALVYLLRDLRLKCQ